METLIDASMEVSLEVNAEKTNNMLLSHHQNAGQNHDIKIARKKIKMILNSGNVYHSVKKLLSSHLLSKNVKIRIYKTIIFPMVLCGCKTCSLTLRKNYMTSFINCTLH
jgi:hypothetical protein